MQILAKTMDCPSKSVRPDNFRSAAAWIPPHPPVFRNDLMMFEPSNYLASCVRHKMDPSVLSRQGDLPSAPCAEMSPLMDGRERAVGCINLKRQIYPFGLGTTSGIASPRCRHFVWRGNRSNRRCYSRHFIGDGIGSRKRRWFQSSRSASCQGRPPKFTARGRPECQPMESSCPRRAL